jgi:hypothetical protein
MSSARHVVQVTNDTSVRVLLDTEPQIELIKLLATDGAFFDAVAGMSSNVTSGLDTDDRSPDSNLLAVVGRVDGSAN